MEIAHAKKVFKLFKEFYTPLLRKHTIIFIAIVLLHKQLNFWGYIKLRISRFL